MKGLQATELLELAEICTTSEVHAFEAGLLELVRRHVGFDFAMFRRKQNYGAVTVGFDPGLLREIVPFWPRFITEGLRTLKGEPAVAADAEWFSRRQLDAALVQRLLARPSGEASGVSLLSWWRGRCVAHLRIGRRHGGFSRAEIDRLRAFMPQIRLSESLRYVQSKFPASALSERSAACKLSAREREIVSYLGLGYTNEQIAAACGSSVHTVRNQLSRAYAKLGVASRAEAVSVLTSAR